MLIEWASSFASRRTTAVEGAKKAAHTAAEMLGRGRDGRSDGFEEGTSWAERSVVESRLCRRRGVEGGATAIAGAAVKGATAAAAGAETAVSGVVVATSKGAAAAMSGGQYAARGIVDASSRGLSAASEDGRRAMEFRVPTRSVQKYTARGSAGACRRARRRPAARPSSRRPPGGTWSPAPREASESPTSNSTTRALYRCASRALRLRSSAA